MSPKKERLTVTVDPHVVRAASAAVARGSAESLSGWVNRALRERVEKEQRQEALRQAIAAYEAESGDISAEEIERQARNDAKAARVVRGRPSVVKRRSVRR